MRVIRDVGEEKGYIVKVSPEEAMRLIKSLSNQMMKGSASVGREEFYTEDEEYFTIAVGKS